MRDSLSPLVRFLFSVVVGSLFFLVPYPFNGKTTVLFDVFVQSILKGFPRGVAVYCLGMVILGAVFSILATRVQENEKNFLSHFRCSSFFLTIRILGAFLAVLMFAEIGPDELIHPQVSGLIWAILVLSVGVIVPLGQFF